MFIQDIMPLLSSMGRLVGLLVSSTLSSFCSLYNRVMPWTDGAPSPYLWSVTFSADLELLEQPYAAQYVAITSIES